ncbi:hypothetical protein GYMLUDRAFT_77842 [Collybiopsis luxurians FD-317 M1]|uniref:RRM domain-containing protein n=1 Tax=Collybiopsis luxurians FD-317 M1 TaxID=944289 RepID=A0A0D0AQ68_9AGAR|nr:hypothetical protein GYMLUDRAFT_77842 [Collybiopsis luxurians FD-317 M1]
MKLQIKKLELGDKSNFTLRIPILPLIHPTSFWLCFDSRLTLCFTLMRQLYTQNAEHWVSIESVASFNRMRQFAQTESENSVQWVVSALRSSEYREVDEEGLRVRRKREVKDPKGQFERSIYAKGFETDETPNTSAELERFFQGYGSTNAVCMRRNEDKSFKGSVFVEFTEPSDVDTFLKTDPKPTWRGTELTI